MLSAPIAVTFVARVIALLLVWWVLTLGELSGMGPGAVIAVLVAWLSLRLFPLSGFRLSPPGFILFFGYFLSRSVVAGLDVARRLLSPTLPINPGEISLGLQLPEGSPRWLLANTLSLMPGTLSVRLEGNQLLLHCLDTGASVERDVRATERRVARVFGCQLASVNEGDR